MTNNYNGNLEKETPFIYKLFGKKKMYNFTSNRDIQTNR